MAHRRAETLRRHNGGGLVQAVTVAERTAEDWARRLEDAGYEVKRQSLQAKRSVMSYVKARPFVALTYAALAGAFMALLLKR